MVVGQITVQGSPHREVIFELDIEGGKPPQSLGAYRAKGARLRNQPECAKKWGQEKALNL